VGIVADLIENDDEAAQQFEAEFATLSRYLTSVQLKAHVDPAGVEPWACDMYGYSGLHHLRRLAAYLHYDQRLPEPGDIESSKDPTLNRYFSDFELSAARNVFRPFDHLIIHSDAEGYYIPQEFDGVLFPGEEYPIAGGMVGSSQRLRDECRKIATALNLPLGLDPEDEAVSEAAEAQGSGEGWKRYGVESYCCLRLHRAANHSLKTGAAIVFV
jgi:hypothetical protein